MTKTLIAFLLLFSLVGCVSSQVLDSYNAVEQNVSASHDMIDTLLKQATVTTPDDAERIGRLTEKNETVRKETLGLLRYLKEQHKAFSPFGGG